ncbi:MAG: hypothetical protein MJE63_29700, partial [Proteobacteria bacterium]|nr:hypothetical protein [Pseudomonadota bacterium]
MSLTNNPNNLSDSIALADILYALNKFEKASLLYSHSIKLLTDSAEANKGEELLKGLQFKNAISLFNAGKYQECFNLTVAINSKAQNDLPTFAFSVLALKKLDKLEQAQKIIEKVDSLSQGLLSGIEDSDLLGQANANLAWFYCFAADQPEKAYNYSIKISKDERGNLPSLRGYIQLLKGDIEQARVTISKCDPGDPLAIFTSAILAINDSQTEKGAELLSLAVNSAPGAVYSFIDEKLKQIDYSSDNINLTDTVDLMLEDVSSEMLDMAHEPAKYVSFGINPSQKYYKFYDVMLADLSVINQSKEDRIVGQGTFIDPYVYVYAEIVPSLKGKVKPKVVPISLRYLAQEPVIRPGFSNSFVETLNNDKLDAILKKYPQMAYKIKFQCVPFPYIDNGNVRSMIPQLKPESVVVERKAFIPSPQKLTSYFKMLRSGQPDERIKAVMLFSSILKENKLAAQGKLFYKSVKLDYDKTIKTIASNLSHEDHLIRAWTVYHCDGHLNNK